MQVKSCKQANITIFVLYQIVHVAYAKCIRYKVKVSPHGKISLGPHSQGLLHFTL